MIVPPPAKAQGDFRLPAPGEFMLQSPATTGFVSLPTPSTKTST